MLNHDAGRVDWSALAVSKLASTLRGKSPDYSNDRVAWS